MSQVSQIRGAYQGLKDSINALSQEAAQIEAKFRQSDDGRRFTEIQGMLQRMTIEAETLQKVITFLDSEPPSELPDKVAEEVDDADVLTVIPQ